MLAVIRRALGRAGLLRKNDVGAVFACGRGLRRQLGSTEQKRRRQTLG